MPNPRPTIIGHHLIWTLYGHCLANDLRGSGSKALYDNKFEALGPIHHGRKPEHMQPSRDELRAFHRNAEPLLNFPRFWIDEAKRQAISEAFTRTVREKGYTVWACAILKNHAHMVIRVHRDDALRMWHTFADAAKAALGELADIGPEHPVWSNRPYKVFLRTPDEVYSRIGYVQRNPEKEGLPAQRFDFVQSYNNWPLHKLSAAVN